MTQRGRPLGELRGRTQEANKLALWLRKITALTTVRELAKNYPCSTTLWSEYRNGSKLIPEVLLVKVVTDLITDAEMRTRQLAEGRRLLKAAQEAERGRIGRQKTGSPAGPQKTPMPPAGVTDVLFRLDDARLQQIEALRKLADSQQRCSQLENMVSYLEAQCAQLAEERDHARLEAQDAQRLQAAIDQTETNRAQAEAHLRHARKANEQAFELRRAAEANVARAQAEARRTAGSATGTGSLLPQPAGSGLDLPPLEQIGDVLRAVREQLAEQDEGLDELRSHLGLPEPDAGSGAGAPNVITGQVIGRQNTRPGDDEIVRENNANNTDNPVTSTDSAPSADLIGILPTLFTASSAGDLGLAVEALRARSGPERWSAEQMAAKANAALGDGETPYSASAVSGWLDGSRFPRELSSLTALIEALGATQEERAAFSTAYLRIQEQESQAFKEAYPRITRHADESFERASLRTALEQERERQGAAREQAARAAREKAERERQAQQDLEAGREARAARDREVRESIRGHQAAELIAEVDQISGIRDLARLLKRLHSQTAVSTGSLVRSVFGSAQDQHVTTVGKWLSGTALPTERHFALLVRALLVTPEEEAALLRARERALHHARNPHTPKASAPVPPAQRPAPTPPALTVPTPTLTPAPSVREAAGMKTKAVQKAAAHGPAEAVRRPDTWSVRKRNADRFIGKADRVIGPKGLSRLLQTLRSNAGLSAKDLTMDVLGSAQDKQIKTVSKWVDGKVLPAKPLFVALVRALLARPDEETALLRAYDRVRAAEEDGGPPRPEPGLGSTWVVTRLGACLVIATLWAVVGACASVNPSALTAPLAWYIAGVAVLSFLVLMETLSSARHTERSAIELFSGLGPLLAVSLGGILPQYPAFELWGRWPAELLGLL
ncbi:hypothetical protein ACGFZH_40110 [Streptomyces zaomyceticus]|uniref:hypothetical protein n=1 Tax=Streptomyces zaomyceticus TaxID=68286 RepID=UPI00371E80A4